MFTIICTLANSTFLGTVEEVERENDYSFERTVSVYGHPGIMIYPKNVWKKTQELPVLDVVPLERYPGDETH